MARFKGAEYVHVHIAPVTQQRPLLTKNKYCCPRKRIAHAQFDSTAQHALLVIQFAFKGIGT